MSDRAVEAQVAGAAALYEAGRFAEAEAVAREVLAGTVPHDQGLHHRARHVVAACRAAVGALDEAAAELAVLVAAVPGDDAVRLQLAEVLAHLKRHGAVVALLAEEVRRRPEFLAGYRPLAAALWESGARGRAVELYRGLVAQLPQDGGAHRALGEALRQEKRSAEALPVLRRAVALLAPAAQGNHGAFQELALARLGLAGLLADMAVPDFAEAAEVAQAARTMGVTDPDVLVTLGAVLEKAGDLASAEECFATALEQRPGHADATKSLSMHRLRRGDFAGGWAGYEMRLPFEGLPAMPRGVPATPWTAPADLRGQCVRVMPEQGAGDRIQFTRYLPMLAARGAEVELVVERGSPLRPLWEGMPAIARFVESADAPGEPDVTVALMSLPLAFGTELASIPAQVPYLAVPAERRAAWRARLGAGDGRPRVGVVWRGNPMFHNDRQRSIPLGRFAPVLRRRDLAFHVLANKLPDGEEAEAAGLATVHRGIGDFADTAALIEAMDLVVSVDTAVAHLAGALAKPVWILLPFAPDWRWMLAREDSPWYPTARLFRQPAPGDWDSVLERVQEVLDATFG